MRLLITLSMLILVAAGVAWLTAGDRLGLTPPRPAPDAADPAVAALADLRPEKVRKIDLTPPGQPTVSLTRNADGTWTQPGNWPVRASEATALLNTLTGLRTRFHPVKVADADLSKYGLAADQTPAIAQVQLDGKTTTLRFGQPPAAESGAGKPTYVRVDDLSEVVRLGPDVWPVLTRPADAYRRRQLFPDADRVKLSGGDPPTDPTRPNLPASGRVALLGDKYESVRVQSKTPKVDVTFKRVAPTPEVRRDPDRPTAEAGLTADRLAEAWELDAADGSTTVRDKVAPAKLRAALTAVPDLWAEKFVEGKTPAETGLDAKPDDLDTLTVTRPGGQATTVRFGKVSRSVTKLEEQPPPSPFAPPPPPPKATTEEYRYAKLDNNPLVFEVRTDKLKDLFAEADTFRDPQLARFEPSEVVDVTVAVKGKPAVKLVKKKGNKDAERDDDKQDRWYVGDLLAESSKVTELLDQLSRLEAKGKDDRVDNPDAAKLKDLGFDAQRASDLSLVVSLLDRLEHHGRPAKESGGGAVTLDRLKALGLDLKEFNLTAGQDPIAQLFAEVDRESKLWGRLKDQLAAKRADLAAGPDATTVTVTAQAKAVEGEPTPPARTFTFVLGKDDADKKKLAVLVAGWPRVNLVDDAVAKNVDRPALAYRGRRLFDTAEAKLTTVGVSKAGGEGFSLAKDDAKWKLTKPLAADADESKASQMTNDLSRLEASEYVDDAPKPEDLDKKYGLATPRFTVDLGFTGTGAKPRTLQIGAARDGKSEAFARLDNAGSVFAVPKATVDSLDAGALALLPLQLWSVPSDKVTALEIRRSEANGGESYRVVKEGGNWKLTGPFDAAVGFVDLQPLLVAAAGVKAEKYEAAGVDDPAKYGFDKPALRLAVTFPEAKPPAAEAPVTRTLVVGKPVDRAAGRYARLDGGPTPAVFVVPESLVKEADKPALGWLDKSLLSLDPDKVTKVQITGPTPDEAVTLARDGANWKAEGAAFAVDKPTAEALVTTAARPPVVRLVAYGDGVKWADYGLDKPAATVTLTTTGTPPTHKLELGKLEPSGERYVRVDGGPAVGVLLPRAAESLARGKLDFVDRTMLAFDPQGLTGLTRVAGKDELELAQAGIGWEVTKPEKQKADAATLEDLADQLGHLRATKVAAYAPADADLPKYGLAEPAATLTLKVGTESKVLKVGGPADTAKLDGDRYAVAVPADPKAAVTVGVLPAALANRLLAPPLKFRDKALAKFVDADKLTLVRGDRTVTFAKVDGTWKVTEPVTADADQTDLDEFVNAAAKLRADELEADKPADLAAFGLDKPEATWTFFAGDKEVLKLLVGAKKDGRAFAKTAAGDPVALLDPALTARVFGEYRKRQIWPDVDASQVQTLILGGDGIANSVLRKEGAGWADPAKPGEAVDAAKVTDTLAALAGLKAERYVADRDAKLELFGLAKPARVLIVTLRDGGTRTLHVGGPVGGTGGKQAYAKAGESGRGEVFVLGEADTAKLTRDRAGCFRPPSGLYSTHPPHPPQTRSPMRVLANYSLDTPAAPGVFARCVDVVADWLRRKGIDPAAAPPGVPTTLPDRFGRQVRVERDTLRSDAGTVAAVRLTEPGDGLEFANTVELAEAAGAVHLFVRLEAGAVGFAPPTHPPVHPPACLFDLLAAAPWAFEGTPVPPGVTEYAVPADGFRLAGQLLSPARRLPILAVSQDPEHPFHPTLTGDLARATAGLAAVAAISPEVSWDITGRLGRLRSCFHGAIRLYWPRLDMAPDPFAHPLWTWDRLAGLAPTPAEAAYRIVGQLKRTLMDRSVEGVRRPGVFDAVRAAALRETYDARVKAAETPDDFQTLAADYAAENDKLRAEVARLREAVARLEAERVARGGDVADVAPESEYPPATPAEAVARARERFADALVFGGDAGRGADRLAAGAGPPRKVFQYLERLAALARAQRENAVGKDPQRWLQEQGVKAGPEGETVRGGRVTRQARTWDFGDGTAQYFDLHLKPNESTTKDKCVRIYTKWCENRRKYVVGWVGPHPD